MSALEQPVPELPPDAVVDVPPIQAADLDVLADLWADDTAQHLADTNPAAYDALEPAIVWRIRDDGEAEWAMVHYRQAMAEVARLDAQLAEYVAKVQRWHTTMGRKARGTAAFMESRLLVYAMARRSAGAGATLRLPSGDVATTDRQPRPTIVDQDALVAWCKDNAPGSVRTTTTEDVLAASMKALGAVVEREDPTTGSTVLVFVSPEGEPIPGVDILAGGVDAKVRP